MKKRHTPRREHPVACSTLACEWRTWDVDAVCGMCRNGHPDTTDKKHVRR